MKLQGTQGDILRTIAEIDNSTSVKVIEDSQIAAETELDLNLVQDSLRHLAEGGLVQLQKVERLSGSGYIVSLTSEGELALDLQYG